MSEWISVKDRLPTSKDVVVLAYGNHKIFIAFYTAVCMGDVYATHWMPLPEAPEIDEELYNPGYMEWLKDYYVNLLSERTDTCKRCRYGSKCEYTTLPPDLRGESCQYYSLAERFGADDK